MSTLKLLDENNEERIKQKEKILNRIKKAINDDTPKSYDKFIENFPEKARYKIISKAILIDVICDLVVMLLEKKEGEKNDKVPSNSHYHPAINYRH